MPNKITIYSIYFGSILIKLSSHFADFCAARLATVEHSAFRMSHFATIQVTPKYLNQHYIINSQ